MDNESVVLINEKLTELQLEKLFALKALRENPGILGNVFSFEKLVYVLNGCKPNVDVLEPPTILHVAKAIQFLNKNYSDNLDWHTEIKKYIACIAHDEGWHTLPEILNFAQNDLDELQKNVELDAEQQKFQELKHKAVKEYLVN